MPKTHLHHLILSFLLLLAGCATLQPPQEPPRLLVVLDKAQIGGNLGYYWGGIIYLAPGATERTLTHELGHHQGQGESGAQWCEIYLWGYTNHRDQ